MILTTISRELKNSLYDACVEWDFENEFTYFKPALKFYDLNLFHTRELLVEVFKDKELMNKFESLEDLVTCLLEKAWEDYIEKNYADLIRQDNQIDNLANDPRFDFRNQFESNWGNVNGE